MAAQGQAPLRARVPAVAALQALRHTRTRAGEAVCHTTEPHATLRPSLTAPRQGPEICVAAQLPNTAPNAHLWYKNGGAAYGRGPLLFLPGDPLSS